MPEAHSSKSPFVGCGNLAVRGLPVFRRLSSHRLLIADLWVMHHVQKQGLFVGKMVLTFGPFCHCEKGASLRNRDEEQARDKGAGSAKQKKFYFVDRCVKKRDRGGHR